MAEVHPRGCTLGTTLAVASGNRLYLRHLREEDVEAGYFAWMNDPETTRYLESRFQAHTVATLKEYIIAHRQDPMENLILAIVLREGDRHIGNIKLGPINWLHRRGDLGLLIGDKSSRGKGYATEAIGLLAEFAFRELNLHKVTAGAYAVNAGSIRAFEKAGFTREGVLLSHSWYEGHYTDLVLFGKHRPEESCS